MRRISVIIAKEFKQIRSDPLMMRLIIFPVLFQLFIIGYALTTEVKHTPVAVVDYDRSPLSTQLIESVKQSTLFVFKGYGKNQAQLHELLDKGRITIGIVIPEDFSERIDKHLTASIPVLIDGQDANASSVAYGYLNAIISQWAMSTTADRSDLRNRAMLKGDVIDVSPIVLFNPRLVSSWYMIPALVVILVTIITSLLTGFSIVKEKERGTFEQLLVTPVGPLEIIAGKIVPYTVIGIFEIIVFMVIAILWFDIPFRGNFFILLVFALVYMISSLGIGILTSTMARTSQQVLFSIWFILIFFILLSGFFIPIENMPHWVQNLTLINPVRYYMHITRSIFLKGAGFSELWQEGCAMLGIGAAVFFLALLSFKRRVSQ